jgi:hypothetical protein
MTTKMTDRPLNSRAASIPCGTSRSTARRGAWGTASPTPVTSRIWGAPRSTSWASACSRSTCATSPTARCGRWSTTRTRTSSATGSFGTERRCSARAAAGTASTSLAADHADFEGIAELHVSLPAWREHERNSLPLTSGEARQMAASLIRAGDLLGRDAYDTDAVVSQRAEPAAVADEIQAVQR